MLENITEYVSRFLPQATPEQVCRWIDRGRSAGGDRFWAFDPIDGTKGYLREGQYAVALALLVAGEPQVGVLGCPELTDAYRPDLDGPGSLVVAARSQGSWTTALTSPGHYEQIHVSSRSDPSQARLLRSYEDAHTDPAKTEALVRQFGIQAEPVRMDSQAKYAILAAGKADALVRFPTPKQPDYREKIWDQAAGSIVLSEAGGCITDVTGKRLDFSAGRTLAHNTGILGTNGRLHDAFVRAIQKL
jgi:3'(2'), 5'-bisphosphate nucleotidase